MFRVTKSKSTFFLKTCLTQYFDAFKPKTHLQSIIETINKRYIREKSTFIFQ